MLTSLWNELLYKPLYNALIWLTSVLPGHHLWLAIVLLTVVIRFLLYLPSKKGLKSQTKLQELQPKLTKLKEKYKSNPQMQAQETMKLYKESGVNPFGSCLPLLIQLPVLIALFTVFRKDLTAEIQHLYAPLQNFDLNTINPFLFGLKDFTLLGDSLSLVEKTKFGKYIMPFIVGTLQFFQMKMLTGKNKLQKVVANKNMPFDPQSSTKMMTYFMPVMIAFISSGYAAGLSLYWATSTSFSILQQRIVLNTKKKHEEIVKRENRNIDEADVVPITRSKKKSKKKHKNQ